jgi:type I restriction enzyme S subunit
MNSDWPLKKLEEVADDVTVGYVGSMAAEYVQSGIPFLRSLNIEPFLVNTKDLKFITPEFHRRIKKSAIRPGDVVIVRTGKPGTCSVIPNWLTDANCSDLVLVKCGKDLRPRFLCYWVNSIAAHHISSHTVGAVQQHFNVGAAKTMMVAVPALQNQDQVIELLGALDDRITLLRETNATLEAIAQALFKSWFVDFDPVRAKMEGRAPEGMDEATAALFPDSFEESVLGLVPMGWRISTVGASFVLTMGQSPPGDTYSEDGNGLPFYQGRTDFGFRFPTKRMYCSEPTRIAEIGDTLVSVRAPVGDVNMAIERCCVGRGVASVRHSKNYRSFTFYAMRGLGQHFENFDSEGTIFGSINKKDFQALPVIAPALPALAAYDAVSSPIDIRIVENEFQIRTLVTLRDTLLPRLISGQLRMPEPQQDMESALQ